MIQTIQEDRFKEEVLQADKPVLVNFHASWCGPCKALDSVLDKVDKEFNNKLIIVNIDVDESSSITSEYIIKVYPTLILLRNGMILEKIMGFTSYGEIESIILKHQISK